MVGLLSSALPAAAAAAAPATSPVAAADTSTLISPALLFVLCVVGAVAMMLVLPGRKEKSIRVLSGVALLAVLIVLGAVIGKRGGGVGVYFWIFSFVALAGAVRVITHTKPVYSALYFVLTVMATAGLFVLMWAEFMAAALILIYAGAILVTYVFVIMLAAEATGTTGAVEGDEEETSGLEHDVISREPVLASAVGFALVGILLFVIFDRAPGDSAKKQATVAAAPITVELPGATQKLGVYLFTTQLVNLELAGLILTVAMVGAILIARRRVIRADETVPAGADVVIGPATPIDDNPHSIPVQGTDDPRQKAYPEA
jgi:NADH-quinone oxidoreductase subunit J